MNVALAPVLGVARWFLSHAAGWGETMPNAYTFIKTVFIINCVLLVFNLLPVYPLDGGQILQSLLWFVFGRARSLMITTVIGFVGVAGLIALAILGHDVWFGILCVFILLNCWRGLMQARVLAKVAKLPRRSGFACPSCHQAPIVGPLWRCDKCLQSFDTFATQAVCPHCGAQYRRDPLSGVRQRASAGGMGRGAAGGIYATVVSVEASQKPSADDIFGRLFDGCLGVQSAACSRLLGGFVTLIVGFLLGSYLLSRIGGGRPALGVACTASFPG